MQAELRNIMERSICGEHLSPPNLSLLIEIGQLVELRRGDCLFREGAENHDVFFLIDGRVDLAMSVPGRGACRILSLGPGELIAWSAVLRGGTMSCSAVCAEDSKVIVIAAPLLEGISVDNPGFGYEFMKMVAAALATRLIATRLQLLDLFRTPA